MGKIGIIGGSGLYKIEGFRNAKEVSVLTPFGKPSDKFTLGELEDKEVVFLPRHGKGHCISPSEINYQANIYALKKLGVHRIISVTACGSLREDFRPLDFVLPDQFVDRTNQARKMTFFEKGIVAHISFAEPVCPDMVRVVKNAGVDLGFSVHTGATYINMEGPAFSTRAESDLYRRLGMDIIGMTNMAEAKLAREAEICFATLAAVTDYDCWYKSEKEVTVDMVVQNLLKNMENAKSILKKAIRDMPPDRLCSCSSALKDAIITDRRVIPQRVKRDLKIIIGKYVEPVTAVI